MKHYSDEMLSAYANDELSPEQRKYVEEHIQDCTDCRKKLNDFKELRNLLISSEEVIPPTDAVEKIMAGIKETRKSGVFRRWRIPAFVAVPLVLVLVLLMTLQPWNSISNTQTVMAKASAAIADLDSYRISVTVKEYKQNRETSVYYFFMEYSAPDRYHALQTDNDTDMEHIFIGNQQYYRNFNTVGVGSRVGTNAFAAMMDKDYASLILATLKDIKKLPEETINGTPCLHYSGVFDEEKALMKSWEQQEKTGHTMSDEVKEKALAEARQRTGTRPVYDLWIGEEDYLLRKIKLAFETNDEGFQMEVLFSDFNGHINIEVPVDANGELLPGWTSPTPSLPNIGAAITSEVDNTDPSHRKIEFNILLTNISQDTLTGIDVSIMNGPVVNRDSIIGYKWRSGQTTGSPYTLDPLGSLEYSVTFTYDATSTSPDAVEERIRSVFINVNYLQDDQQRIETFHLETPDTVYTLSDELPPYLVPLDLTPAGEYRINEPGASYAGSRTTGVINGKKYLFISVDTQGSETPAPPGLLVLDIDDKTTPEKVSYVSTPGDVEYLKGNPALYGTVLYLSTNSYLWVLDVSNPSEPVELARLPELTVNQIIVSGNYAFVNENNHRVTALDISDPAKPEQVGSLWLDSLSILHLHENYLYTEVYDILYIIDVSDPSSPELVGEYPFENYHATGISLYDNYVFAGLNSDDISGISVVNISKPDNLVEETFIELDDRDVSGQVYTYDGRLYVFTRREYSIDRALGILDISDPIRPAVLRYGSLPDFHEFFDFSYSSSVQGHYFIENYLYWFIGNNPNQPVIEIFDLSGDLTGG
ncbi:zf-HC2 domain-containing protein [Chloroflexota bacterium]